MVMREDAQAPAAFTRARRTHTCLYRRGKGGLEGEGRGRGLEGGGEREREGKGRGVCVVRVGRVRPCLGRSGQ